MRARTFIMLAALCSSVFACGSDPGSGDAFGGADPAPRVGDETDDSSDGNDDDSDGEARVGDPLVGPDGGPTELGSCHGEVVAWCRTRNDDSDSRPLVVAPLDTISCAARYTGVPAGRIVDFEWTIAERPSGSTSVVQGTRLGMEFFVDLAGRYVIQARVATTDGMPACSVGEVVVSSVPTDDIHLQLVWDTPGDTDPTDICQNCGSDMDLHFVHPSGTYWDEFYDCHYRNPGPDWSYDNVRSNDPRLDIDDIDGAGPENINQSDPEPGSYLVGAHYFDDKGYGPSSPTVRIYLGGQLRYEAYGPEMRTADMWSVAEIDWPSGNVYPINDLFILPYPD